MSIIPILKNSPPVFLSHYTIIDSGPDKRMFFVGAFGFWGKDPRAKISSLLNRDACPFSLTALNLTR